MPREDDRKGQVLKVAPRSNALGAFIRKARQDVGMSLREVEDATSKEVSNGYLSQLESGKISQPSPRILHALSQALNINYGTLMQRAGYLLPETKSSHGGQETHAGRFVIDNLTADEESQLLEYLTFLRTKKK